MTTTVHALDLRVGGRYRFEMRDPDGKSHIVIGEYREIDAPTRLVFTWAWESEQAEDTQETLVSLLLREQGKATEMLLTHKRFPSERSRELHNQGWAGCLARLEQLLAAGCADDQYIEAGNSRHSRQAVWKLKGSKSIPHFMEN